MKCLSITRLAFLVHPCMQFKHACCIISFAISCLVSPSVFNVAAAIVAKPKCGDVPIGQQSQSSRLRRLLTLAGPYAQDLAANNLMRPLVMPQVVFLPLLHTCFLPCMGWPMLQAQASKPLLNMFPSMQTPSHGRQLDHRLDAWQFQCNILFNLERSPALLNQTMLPSVQA